jgi:hypothetical protein
MLDFDSAGINTVNKNEVTLKNVLNLLDSNGSVSGKGSESTGNSKQRARQYVASKMVSLFVHLFDVHVEENGMNLVPSLHSFIADSLQQGSDFWLVDSYRDQFKKIPELEELTTTPFMVEVVTEILPVLSVSRRTTNEYKSGFVMLVGTEIAEVIWENMQEVNPIDRDLKDKSKRSLEVPKVNEIQSNSKGR